MARRKRLRVGDVFSIPLDEERVGYGQIVYSSGHGNYYFAVFEEPHPRDEEPNLEEIVGESLALAFAGRGIDVRFDVWRGSRPRFRPRPRGADEIVVPAQPRDQMLRELTTVETLVDTVDPLLEDPTRRRRVPRQLHRRLRRALVLGAGPCVLGL